MKTANNRSLCAFVCAIAFFFVTFARAVYAEGETATSTPSDANASSTPHIVVPVSATTSTITAAIHVRYYDDLAYEGPVTLSIDGITPIADTASVSHDIPADSVLSALSMADAESDAFRASDIAYYASFNSLLVNCIEISSASTTACYNWQYAVNDMTPFVGADAYELHNGDDVYWYFGQPHRVTLATSTITMGQTDTATAEQYTYRTNEWLPLPGVTIGATQLDPANPWSPLVFATSTTNNSGIAVFTLSATGTYNIGIAEDYYYPTIPLTVVEPAPTVETSAEEQVPVPAPQQSGGGFSHNKIDTEKALRYLLAHQASDGSMLNSALYSDWSAIAFGSWTGENAGRDALKRYLLADPSPGVRTTDYERRAMALLALGINPYTGTNTNYVQKILDAFDGAQVGDPSLYNDDIFALFPLLHAGYTKSDGIIASTTKFIVGKQEENGSWGGVDLTAAAIQALSLVSSFDDVGSSLVKARAYLVEEQKDNGGFGDSADSTSWTLQAIAALNESELSWVKNNNTPNDYLAGRQHADGGMDDAGLPETTRVWSTTYAIPAALGKTWDAILSRVEKPAIPPETPLSPSPQNFSGGNTTIIITPEIQTTSTVQSSATTTPPLPPKAVSTSPVPIPPAQSLPPPTILPAASPSASQKIAGIKIKKELPVEETPTTTAEISNTEITSSPEPQKEASPHSLAKNAFAYSAVASTGLGLYLLWKLLKGMI